MKQDNMQLAELINECAQAMNAHDKKHETNLCSGPNSAAQKMCSDICQKKGNKDLGYIVYLLLAYTWNDALDWSDTIRGVL